MINSDLFKPSISPWQHYLTVIIAGGSALTYSFGPVWVGFGAAETFFIGAAVEGTVNAFRAGKRR